MTEKEKMQRHVLYDANYDKELIEERKVAKELCYDFNQLRPSDEEGQQGHDTQSFDKLFHLFLRLIS